MILGRSQSYELPSKAFHDSLCLLLQLEGSSSHREVADVDDHHPFLQSAFERLRDVGMKNPSTIEDTS